MTLEDTPDPNLETAQAEAPAAETAPETPETETNAAIPAPKKGAEGRASDTGNSAGDEVQSTLF